MTAINFSRRFAKDVRLGKKRRTIRRTKKGTIGGRLQLYTGMRTKSCRKLGDAVLTDVMHIKIHENFLILGKKKMSGRAALDRFAQKDGHPDWKSLVAWFSRRYDLPFSGFLHEWKKL